MRFLGKTAYEMQQVICQSLLSEAVCGVEHAHVRVLPKYGRFICQSLLSEAVCGVEHANVRVL